MGCQVVKFQALLVMGLVRLFWLFFGCWFWLALVISKLIIL
jgi:hypothetical protein